MNTTNLLTLLIFVCIVNTIFGAVTIFINLTVYQEQVKKLEQVRKDLEDSSKKSLNKMDILAQESTLKTFNKIS